MPTCKILTEKEFNKLDEDIQWNLFRIMEDVILTLTRTMQKYALNNKKYPLYEKIKEINNI